MFNDIYQYGIKNTCNERGFFCERVDEQVFEGTILSRIYTQIRKADLIISDLSNKNPNVYYETGYAHALSKPVILLTKNAEDIPFDLKHYPHIVYNGKIKDLSSMLERKLDWYIEDFSKINTKNNKLSLYNDGVLIENNAKLKLYWTYYEITHQDFEPCLFLDIDIYNENLSKADYVESVNLIFDENELFKEDSFKIATNDIRDYRIKLPNNKILIKSMSFGNIGALNWGKINILIANKNCINTSIEEFNEKLITGTLKVLFENLEPIEYDVKFEITDNLKAKEKS